jgi:predicted  nucleic acid-binding Zn-ribbon protein
MAKTTAGFETLFGSEASLIGRLYEFSGKVTEGNFLDTADNFLLNKGEFQATVKKIEKIGKFIKSNLLKAHNIKRFVDELKIELEKANASTADFEGSIERFTDIYSKSVVDNYKELLAEGQKLKDAYHALMVAANEEMSDAHSTLRTAANATMAEISKYPEALNRNLFAQVKAITDYAEKRRNDAVNLDYTIRCSNCHFSLSEMKNNTALVPQKMAELLVAEMSILKEAPPAPEPTPTPIPRGSSASSPTPAPKPPKRLSLKISRRTTVGDFKKMLQLQLQQVAGMQDSDEIEIDL